MTNTRSTASAFGIGFCLFLWTSAVMCLVNVILADIFSMGGILAIAGAVSLARKWQRHEMTLDESFLRVTLFAVALGICVVLLEYVSQFAYDTSILEFVKSNSLPTVAEHGWVVFLESRFINLCFNMTGPLHLSLVGIALGGICTLVWLWAAWPNNPVTKSVTEEM